MDYTGTNIERAKVGRQRNMLQRKEQEKYPEKELNKMEASKLQEYKTMVLKILQKLRKRMN